MSVTSTARSAPNAIARKLDVIQSKGALKSVDIANVLGTRPETVSRWNQGRAFPQRDKEKLILELEYVVDRLSDLYEPDDARLWLFSRQKLLGGKTPAELIQKGHTEEVLQVIGQQSEGVYL